jgi:ElaA protein
MEISWKCVSFQELSTEELYQILRLRSEVFVVEQQCLWVDCDNKDQESYHLMGWNEHNLLAYTRLLPAGLSYDEMSIGRVATSQNARGTGVGKVLMQKSLEEIERIFGRQPIKIGAQIYLQKFYENFGFTQTSEVYIEDGIDHIEMLRGIK